MTRVTLKGLAGRKLRAALTALAIVLGVAMVSGTFVLTDTIDKGVRHALHRRLQRTRRRRLRQERRRLLVERRRDRPAEAARATVRALPEVEAAAGAIIDDGDSTRRAPRPRRQADRRAATRPSASASTREPSASTRSRSPPAAGRPGQARS